MHVVHVTPYFAPAFVYGGPPRSILALCQGLRAADVNVEVVTTVANGASDLPASPPQGDRYDDVPVFYAPRAFPGVFFNAAVAEPIRAALSRADICHIHGLWTVPAWIAARMARQMNVPFVVSPRGMLHPAALQRHRLRKKVAFQLLDRQHLNHAVRVHATADEEADILRGIVDPGRIVTIPNGVDVSAADRATGGARRKLGIPDTDPVIVFIGRLHPIKRLDLLLDAVARVRERHPSTHLVLGGPDEGALVTLGSRLDKLGPAVHLTGPLNDDDKWSLLREATALVLCSDSENFGMSVVEAMAAACPVVVTETCPWREVAEQGCGFWVPQRADAIAEALEALAADPVAAKARGAQGARLVRAKYGWRAVGGEMAACYADILSVRRQVA